MNLTSAQGEALALEVSHLAFDAAAVEVVVCPSFLGLPKVADVLRRSEVKVGAQDVFWMDKGAFTGCVSPNQLLEFGVSYCIVGHSETRGRFGVLEVPEGSTAYFAETDGTVNLKLKALLFHGIAPILCVGETKGERDSGLTDPVIRGQLSGALVGIEGDEMDSLVVAYEPVWAIGTGLTCDSGEAERVCGLIRSAVGDLAGSEAAERVRVLYGGSVKPDNAGELFSQPNIDGGLVGGASLDAKGFGVIVGSA